MYAHARTAKRARSDCVSSAQKAVSRFHQDRLVTASKKMPPKDVPRVDPTREGVLQPSHPPGKIRLRSLQQKMVVVAHQHEGVNLETHSAHWFT